MVKKDNSREKRIPAKMEMGQREAAGRRGRGTQGQEEGQNEVARTTYRLAVFSVHASRKHV